MHKQQTESNPFATVFLKIPFAKDWYKFLCWGSEFQLRPHCWNQLVFLRDRAHLSSLSWVLTFLQREFGVVRKPAIQSNAVTVWHHYPMFYLSLFSLFSRVYFSFLPIVKGLHQTALFFWFLFFVNTTHWKASSNHVSSYCWFFLLYFSISVILKWLSFLQSKTTSSVLLNNNICRMAPT